MKKMNVLCSALLSSLLAVPAVLAEQREDAPTRQEHPRRGERQGRALGQHWKEMDQDNDQRISRNEWKGKEETFNRLDADHDGFLTHEEFQSASKEFRGKRRGGFQRMDENNDGNIARSEWKGKEETFDRLDLNHDGLLTRDELKHGRPRRQSLPGTG
jgi:EF-hand domain pair